MPFIHVYAYSGRDEATKQKAAQAMVKAAGEAMGVPETAFTVVYEDIAKENWEADIVQKVIEPLRGSMLIDKGRPV